MHENIAGFGGDPDNVTIWGESAGATSVTLLALVEGSHRYFNKVIALSGSPALTRSKEQAIACTDELLDELGCKTVADLRKLDAGKLLDAASKVLALHTAPERDGSFLPENPFDAVANGATKDLTFLHGCNKDEMNFFLVGLGGPEPFVEWAAGRKAKILARLTEEEKALVESFCNDVKGESYEPYTRLFSQIMFNAPVIRLTECQTLAGGRAFAYFFTPESSVPLMKCAHGVELPALFKHPDIDADTGRTFDETFSKTLRKMWVQFAKTGNPSLHADASPDGKTKIWPLYDLENRNVMVLDEFDIHPASESDLKITDRIRTYFLTRYYAL